MSFLSDNCSLCELADPTELQGFSCGDRDLDDFFSNDCFNYAIQLLGKSFCYKVDDEPHSVVGAFTLSNASIRVDDLPNARRKKIESDIPHVKALKDYPAVLVGRLAVSDHYRHMHVGSDVLEFIKYWFIDPNNKTGCRFVTVDAYNSPDTIAFYQSNGFKPVFSSDQQEKDYRHIKDDTPLRTRLMFFDLLPLSLDK